jgi:glycosyltransferase involved in cell wall biosynthesis
MYKLSILIPSLLKRKDYLARLLDILKPQITNEIEVLVDIDNGETRIGAKRNALLTKATGQYTCFIDDDDKVSSNYIELILEGINQGVDVVNITGIRTQDGRCPRKFVDKAGCPWSTGKDGVYYRSTQHLDAIKSSISKKFKFQEIDFGEDRFFSEAIEASGLVKTSYQIKTPIYFYEFRTTK